MQIIIKKREIYQTLSLRIFVFEDLSWVFFYLEKNCILLMYIIDSESEHQFNDRA